MKLSFCGTKTNFYLLNNGAFGRTVVAVGIDVDDVVITEHVEPIEIEKAISLIKTGVQLVVNKNSGCEVE